VLGFARFDGLQTEPRSFRGARSTNPEITVQGSVPGLDKPGHEVSSQKFFVGIAKRLSSLPRPRGSETDPEFTSCSPRQLCRGPVLPPAFFAFLAVNAAYGIWLQRKKMRMNWQIADGEITVSRMDRTGMRISSEARDTGVDVRYRDRVGGNNHEGHRLRFGRTNRMTALQAGEITGKYSPGARVSVYYDPQRCRGGHCRLSSRQAK
jgi:Protein of unknown function (DUF3592)